MARVQERCHLLQTLNLTVDQAMSLKRTRKLLEQDYHQDLCKMQIEMCEVLREQKIKHKKSQSYIPGPFRAIS